MGIEMEISNLVKKHMPTPAGMIFYDSFESVKHDKKGNFTKKKY